MKRFFFLNTILLSTLVSSSMAFLGGSQPIGCSYDKSGRRVERPFARLSMSSEPFEGTVVVCTGPTCTSKGGGKGKTLPIFEDIADGSDGKISVETISCVSECAECAMGPNVELRAKDDSGPFYPIKNNVKTEADIKSILGLE